jgi:hypothetical protein
MVESSKNLPGARSDYDLSWLSASILGIAVGMALGLSSKAQSQQGPNHPIAGFVARIDGSSAQILADQATWKSLRVNQRLLVGDTIRTGSETTVTVRLSNRSTFELAALSEVTLEYFEPKSGEALLGLGSGKIRAQVIRRPNSEVRFKIRSGAVVAGVRGTHFMVIHQESASHAFSGVMVESGLVEVRDPATGELIENLSSDQALTVASNTLLTGNYFPISAITPSMWDLQTGEDINVTNFGSYKIGVSRGVFLPGNFRQWRIRPQGVRIKQLNRGSVTQEMVTQKLKQGSIRPVNDFANDLGVPLVRPGTLPNDPLPAPTDPNPPSTPMNSTRPRAVVTGRAQGSEVLTRDILGGYEPRALSREPARIPLISEDPESLMNTIDALPAPLNSFRAYQPLQLQVVPILSPPATATPQPTATATPQPTATATPQPTATATPQPTATTTPRPSPNINTDEADDGHHLDFLERLICLLPLIDPPHCGR